MTASRLSSAASSKSLAAAAHTARLLLLSCALILLTALLISDDDPTDSNDLAVFRAQVPLSWSPMDQQTGLLNPPAAHIVRPIDHGFTCLYRAPPA